MDNSHNTRIEILKSYLKEDPEDSFSNYALALEYLNDNQDQLAVDMLEGILRKDENYLAAYYQLGKAYEKISRIEDARRTYKRGIPVGIRLGNQKTVSELRSAVDSLDDDE